MVRYTTVSDERRSAPVDPGQSVDVPSLTPGGPVDLGPVANSPASPTPVGARRAATSCAPPPRSGHTPGWVWIAPARWAALAAVIFAQALDASPAVLRRRPGALTRLSEPGAEP